MRRFLLVAAFASWTPFAHAQAVAPSDCGAVDELGDCQGDLLRFCSNGALQEWDCSHQVTPDNADDDYFTADVAASCIHVSDAYGFDCGINAGGACVFDDGQGGLIQAYCSGTGPGCIADIAAGTTSCAEQVPSCPGGATGCAGNLAVVACLNGQPLAVDCESGGGTCGADGTCVFPDAGSDAPPPSTTAPCGGPCAGGQICNASTNTCSVVHDDSAVRDAITNAQNGEDPGTGDDETPPERHPLFDCASTMTAGGPPSAALILLALCAVRRRAIRGAWNTRS